MAVEYPQDCGANEDCKITNSSANAGLQIDATTGRDPYIDFKENGSLKQNIFWDGSAEKMMLASLNSLVVVGGGNATVQVQGMLGVGTSNPASKLEVDGGDIEVDDSSRGLILRDSAGTRWRVTVDTSGNLMTSHL